MNAIYVSINFYSSIWHFSRGNGRTLCGIKAPWRWNENPTGRPMNCAHCRQIAGGAS
jgi:hypothetical protein